MKKIMSGLIAAVLMAVGLMAFSGAAANAAGSATPAPARSARPPTSPRRTGRGAHDRDGSASR